MNFLTTARLLMELRSRFGRVHYEFNDAQEVVIRIPIDADVPQMFVDAAKMFEPV